MSLPADCRQCPHYSRDMARDWCERKDHMRQWALYRLWASPVDKSIKPPAECPLRKEAQRA